MSEEVSISEQGSGLPTVSYSKVTTFKMCPKKYKFTYIDNIKTPDTSYTIFGKFCHEVLQYFHKNLIENKRLQQPLTNTTGPEIIKSAMISEFNSALSKYKSKLVDDQIKEGYEIMKLYLRNVLAHFNKIGTLPNITGLEKKIWLPVENKFNFYGVVDRIQVDDDGVVHVMDYKTTKNKKYLKDRTQLMLYGCFLKAIGEPINDKVRTSFVLLRHKIELMTEEHDLLELTATKDKFLRDWDEVEKEKLFRANARFDTCTLCSYANICEEGTELLQRKKTFIGEEKGWQ